ncbi:folylpolyglutamate synthase, mitochondrial-like isoform X3 [Crassostrea angulata]|uniref:folylpolyglutamate synthase, mitochondrial-like isoform X3 n=1 Tax=Magallana angulata TaxID=2784310 RepID=UPI0022B2002C|nr:folylpolyglutamate synthase, mitochondrial-like isoform X3 [Crassostrea angulata]
MTTKFLRTLSSVASSAEINKKYEEAVTKLNTLQSNAQTLEKIRKQGGKRSEQNVPNMIKFAERVGISLDDVDKLSIIHVSGTKGKGSTCAFCESILRHQGYKTGFFSSPHLVEVRERFRIDGIPISREKFTNYFWDVLGKLEKTKKSAEDPMPAYFAFLTVMSLHVFLKEKVDVAIMEVGIGGQYDSTNLVRKPVVCGVSSLGLDHTSILGETIDKIAWHKAGIFKPGVPAFTSLQQEAALNVLQNRAKEIGCPLTIVPPLPMLDSNGDDITLGISGTMQRHNAALAVQLCKVWTDSQQKDQSQQEAPSEDDNNHQFILNHTEVKTLPTAVTEGLRQCRWDGRDQRIHKTGVSYYLDGAHTLESVQQCIEWFKTSSAEESKQISGRVIRILLFNSTGDREANVLIEPLVDCGFDAAVFCPNILFSTSNTVACTPKKDATNLTVTKESQLNRVLANMLLFERLAVKKLQQQKHEKESTQTDTSCSAAKKSKLDNDSLENGDNSQHTVCMIEDSVITKDFPCISSALTWATQGREPNTSLQSFTEVPSKLRNAEHIQILVTGSIHLVGGVIGLIGSE